MIKPYNMKTLLTILVLASVTAVQATIIQVNNNAGADADYVLLQDAINNASAGDTIYLVGSPSYYDGTDNPIRVNKQLTIIGPGYFLGENGGSGSNLTAKIYQMILGQGSDDSKLMGLDIAFSSSSYLLINSELADGNPGTIAPDNITVERNKLDYLSMLTGNNLVIRNNFSTS